MVILEKPRLTNRKLSISARIKTSLFLEIMITFLLSMTHAKRSGSPFIHDYNGKLAHIHFSPLRNSATRSDEHGRPVFRNPPLKKFVNCSANNRAIEIL